MQRYAEVIVDVPTMQTNQPFHYLIPAYLQAVVEPGMRVDVPFGNGTRRLQGFVVGLTDELPEGLNPAKLKEIVAVLDLTPVLNQELLELSKSLAERTFAFRITALQTMLPNVMRSKSQKFVRVCAPIPLEQKERVLMGLDEITWEEAVEQGNLKEIQELHRSGKIEFRYEVQTKNRAKAVQFLRPALAATAWNEVRSQIRVNATQQHRLLNLLEELGDQELAVAKAEKVYQVQRATVQTGAKNGWLTLVQKEVYRTPELNTPIVPTQALALHSEQQVACAEILASFKKHEAQTFLLEGITGSGKTEVYLQAIQEVLANGQSAIMLVPEIALTPQMVRRFKERFGEEVAVLHSRLSSGERYDEWRKIERDEAHVVVGARSAIFAPIKRLGLIIMDEEHEASYKQDETPRYHTREVAQWRANYHHCPLVLGSATPSLESRARAQKGVYKFLQLTHRATTAATLPSVRVLDMREELGKGGTQTFSQPLLDAMQQRLDRNEQIVLLLNRRGFSSFMMCRDCGYVLPCPNCDISLTLHMDSHSMKCHYCGHEEAIPQRCAQCQSSKIRYYGTGTQKVEQELQNLFPEETIIRMDVDTTRKKGQHEKLLEQFEKQEARILLGTQMIAKGLDFPNVTLVGVLNADTALNLPDFRASERTFQLLTQVSGRAGRGSKKGEVIVQTFNPQHYAIQLAQAHDYEAFYQREMFMRHQSDYPPYYFTTQLVTSHEEESEAARALFQIAKRLKECLSPQSILLGPVPKSVARVNNRYFYQLLIKYKKEDYLEAELTKLAQELQNEQRNGLRLSIDPEPLNFI